MIIQLLDVVVSIIAEEKTIATVTKTQLVVNGMVNGVKTRLNPALDQKETARKSADLRAV